MLALYARILLVGFHEITSCDIDFSDGYQIYVGTDIFVVGASNLRDLKGMLEKGTYIFEVPVNVGECTFVVNISRLLPGTEERYALLEDPEGYKAKVGTCDITVLLMYFPQNQNSQTIMLPLTMPLGLGTRRRCL
ncbi:MAG: hypothetical protein FWG10_08915 [Eubacteriaceae bacterium]|nr:hypothetical protein [Eubacteriaceae bacterium]